MEALMEGWYWWTC